MKINIPETCLVVLIGASGSGKSTFAKKHFQQYEVLSSDYCRGLVCDDENSQAATNDAFDVLHYIAGKRLGAAKLTVIDATNVQKESRKSLLQFAKQYHYLTVAIVLNLPEEVCHSRNQQRPDRQFGDHVVRRHTQLLQRSLKNLDQEGFRYVYILNCLEEIDSVEIQRKPLWNNKKYERGPFDIIGDIHGCCDELESLLEKLGYKQIEKNPENNREIHENQDSPFWDYPTYYHPEGRKAVFLGDLIDRGPRILDTVKLVRNMVVGGYGLCVPGNHENKLSRKLRGKNVKVNHGLEQTVAEIDSLLEEVRETYCQELRKFIDSLVGHYVLDDGKLVVAHAGLRQEMHGRSSGAVKNFALYGETTGEIDEFGLPVRLNWAGEYRAQAMVVYGHTPVPEAEWLNNTIDIDTGCVFGGKLTGLRYPERELVSVAAAKIYCEPIKPLGGVGNQELEKGKNSQQQLDDVLNIEDVLGKRIISTRWQKNITIREENSIAALEVMSRFAANPKWLIYLPPTMSPVETSKLTGYLEHPYQAIAYYQKQGVTEVICEEKHMGSRAVVIVCKDEIAAQSRFGVVNEGIGICYTRTGRRFFNDSVLEAEFLARVNTALTNSDFWEKFNTSWVCLDCELMPWSAKAQGLIKEQYAAVGAASTKSLQDAVSVLEMAKQRGIDVSDQLKSYQEKAEMADKYVAAYRRYCWNVSNISDLKLAPFHILATEGAVHTDKDHIWHMEQIANFTQLDPELLLATKYKIINITKDESILESVTWWEELTKIGGEGMVVKPLEFIAQSNRESAGIIQPAVKCRGQEYLRIIYGQDYTNIENLQRLRQRGLSLKRSLAMREFALGIEALERFVAHSPLRKVHECVFGILALESEAVDPRL
jgi:protein phosphatase